jgi:isoleucyl-tRNA synthetase
MNGDHVTLGERTPKLNLTCGLKKNPRTNREPAAFTPRPGHGADDFHIAKNYGLKIYCPVDSGGKFTQEVEHFAGEFIFKANPKIVEFLKSRTYCFYGKLRSPLPALLACKKPVIFRATPQGLFRWTK